MQYELLVIVSTGNRNICRTYVKDVKVEIHGYKMLIRLVVKNMVDNNIILILNWSYYHYLSINYSKKKLKIWIQKDQNVKFR